MKVIGILGGTFDPIHNGHLALATLAERTFKLNKIYFVPNAVPPHRDTPNANSVQRQQMIELALTDHPHWALDDCELKRNGPSYILDTLKHFRQRFPHDSLVLLLGLDSLLTLNHWHGWQHFLDYCHLAVFSRPHYSLNNTPNWLREFLHAHQTQQAEDLARVTHGKVFLIDTLDYDISATELRHIVKLDHLPVKVYNYIMQHKLYLLSREKISRS